MNSSAAISFVVLSCTRISNTSFSLFVNILLCLYSFELFKWYPSLLSFEMQFEGNYLVTIAYENEGKLVRIKALDGQLFSTYDFSYVRIKQGQYPNAK